MDQPLIPVELYNPAQLDVLQRLNTVIEASVLKGR